MSSGDQAIVKVWTPNLPVWSDMFSSDGIAQTDWEIDTHDVSSKVGDSDSLRVMFQHRERCEETASGWNIDAFEVLGRTSESCDAFQGEFPGEASQLRVDRAAAGELQLSWSADCGAATTYGVYRGNIEAGYDSIAPEPGLCDVTGTVATVPEGTGDGDFFLVVPNNDGLEGSYGAGSGGARGLAIGACYPQGAVDICTP